MNRLRPLLLALALLPLPALPGCGQQQPRAADWPNVDLDGVLAAAVETLEQPLPEGLEDEATAALDAAEPAGVDAAAPAADAAAAGTPTTLVEVPMSGRVPRLDDAFLRRFEANLNDDAPPLWAAPLSVRFHPDGSLIGSAAETPSGGVTRDLFRVQVDAENSRLVASDLLDADVHREEGYSFRPGGFFMGYMIGSMLGGQRGFFGRGAGAGPGFDRMSMAPDGYAKRGSGFATDRSRAQAQSRARSTSSSSRSLGGSRSFMGGK